MKTKTFRPNKVNIITLGCAKNLVDSEVLSAQLQANDIAVAHESRRSDHEVVIINTCGFIDKAKAESIQTILQQVERKKSGKVRQVIVTGCLSARYQNELAAEIPEVDAWFGTEPYREVLQWLQADYKQELVGERLLSTPRHYAYLKISEGCNRTCAFCAIPLMRGKHQSRPMDEILLEARKLAEKGVKELILIAQELTYYGLDLYKKRMLGTLLEKLTKVPGIEWIRLHYAYPAQFPLDILDVVKSQPKICKYLDIPLQHISDPILLAMHRQTNRAYIEQLIHKIRETIPEICLRTTFIVGFPGETPQHVDELMAFMEKTRFDRVGVFTYSHEEHTRAFHLPDTISQEEKEKRAERVMDCQREISYEKNLARIGQVLKVIVDRREAGRFVGRTEYDSPEVDNEVIIHSPKNLSPGQFVKVHITQAYDYDLEGRLVD
ncbi:MAG: 30S ribosomal protein S12 methylthiotransferase RimO [Thermoflavifilum sp.]|nr:30S ribosomal protein S12 methylthiotransferase RimO [Thermoflavifilum sp.]